MKFFLLTLFLAFALGDILSDNLATSGVNTCELFKPRAVTPSELAALISSNNNRVETIRSFLTGETKEFSPTQVLELLNQVRPNETFSVFQTISQSIQTLNNDQVVQVLKTLLLGVDRSNCDALRQASSVYEMVVRGSEKGSENCLYGKVTAKNVYFVVDISLSMLWGANGVSRLSIVQRELADVLRKLNSNQIFNIIQFAQQYTVMWSTSVLANQQNVEKSISMLNSIRTASYTNIYDTLEGILTKVIPSSEEATVYFLTDGVPNYGKYTRQQDIVEQVTKLNQARKVPAIINCISMLYGKPMNSGDKPETPEEIIRSQLLMSQISARNNGFAKFLNKQ